MALRALMTEAALTAVSAAAIGVDRMVSILSARMKRLNGQ